jgi:ribosomal protein S8
MTTAIKPLASLLQELNLLRRFYRLNKSVYRVFPTYFRHRKTHRSVKFYTRVRGRIHLSLQSLRLLNINSPHSYYVLETSKGVLTHKEALKLKEGGLLLLIIR